jgi:hypothetical protein
LEKVIKLTMINSENRWLIVFIAFIFLQCNDPTSTKKYPFLGIFWLTPTHYI